MAEYTFQCPECLHVETVSRSVKDGPPADLEHCGIEMVRKYRPIRAVAFNAFNILMDWNDENYHRMKANGGKRNFKHFSPHRVKAPGPGTPMKEWHYRSVAYENEQKRSNP